MVYEDLFLEWGMFGVPKIVFFGKGKNLKKGW